MCMCTQRGEEEIHAFLSPLLLACFAFWVFWEEVVLKEEALRNPSSHFTDEETEAPRGTSTGPKSHSECGVRSASAEQSWECTSPNSFPHMALG